MKLTAANLGKNDELGRIVTASDSIQIYPAGVSGFYLPSMFHTDSTVNLVTGAELTYIKVGDYDIPALVLDEEPERDVFYGKYGSLRRDCLR